MPYVPVRRRPGRFRGRGHTAYRPARRAHSRSVRAGRGGSRRPGADPGSAARADPGTSAGTAGDSAPAIPLPTLRALPPRSSRRLLGHLRQIWRAESGGHAPGRPWHWAPDHQWRPVQRSAARSRPRPRRSRGHAVGRQPAPPRGHYLHRGGDRRRAERFSLPFPLPHRDPVFARPITSRT